MTSRNVDCEAVRAAAFVVLLTAALSAYAFAQVPDTTPPTVTEVTADGTPLPGAVLTSAPSSIIVTFSEDVDPATVNVDTFRLVRSGGDGTFGDGNEIEIVPDSVTLDGTGMVATVDLAGVTMADDDYQVIVSGAFPPIAGLVAHWKFDETNGTTAYDSSGNGNHGTLMNGATWEPAGGVLGGALRFDGVDGQVMVPSGSSLEPDTAITLAAWALVTNSCASAYADLIRKETAGVGYLLRWSHWDSRLQFRMGRTASADMYLLDTQSNSAYLDLWHHYAATYDRATGQAYLYVDSAVRASITGLSGSIEHLTDLYLMYSGEGAVAGSLDDVRIYDRALSAAEIAELADPIVVTDLAGNPLDGDGDGTPGPDYTCVFAIDTTPPVVVSTSPADGATTMDIRTDVTITFSEPMDEPTLFAAFSTSPSIAGDFYLGANSLTFDPLADLPNGTTYTVTVSTGATDLAGHALESPYTFTFTVNDDTEPYVLSTSPPDGATDVALSATVTVTFSESVDAAATEAAFSIDPAVSGTPVASGDVLTLVPSGGLESDTQYTVTISTSATDLVGLALAADHTFTFITIDLTAPAEVTELTAHASAIDIELVWRNPFDLDFSGVVIVRSVDEAPTGSPSDGETYAAGNVIGNAVVLHVGTAATGIPGSKSGWSELGVEEGREYHYGVFTYDERLNYSSGVTVNVVPGEGGGGKNGLCGAGGGASFWLLVFAAGAAALARRRAPIPTASPARRPIRPRPAR